MGTYRLILALCVAASHCGALFYGFNEGNIAVVSFLLLSGFVMTLLIRKHYETRATIVHFYADRAVRLLPQFFVYTAASLLLLLCTPLGELPLPWIKFQQCGAAVLAANFSLFGNNFYWLFGPCELIPASWSLGLEGFFYLAIPFILQSSSKRLRMTLVVFSLSCFVLACVGFINFDKFAYRLLFGNLFIFLTGSSLALPSMYHRLLPKTIFGVAALMLAIACTQPSMRQTPGLRETLIGLVIGIPLVGLLSGWNFGKFDETLGNISYGVFLNHLLVLWLFIWAFHLNRSTPHAEFYFLGIMATAMLLSWITFILVEKPLIGFRHSLRSVGPKTAGKPIGRLTEHNRH